MPFVFFFVVQTLYNLRKQFVKEGFSCLHPNAIYYWS